MIGTYYYYSITDPYGPNLEISSSNRGVGFNSLIKDYNVLHSDPAWVSYCNVYDAGDSTSEIAVMERWLCFFQ